MNKYVRNAGICVGIFATGAAVGKFAGPAKIVEKEKIQYVDRVVEKTVETKDTNKKNQKEYHRIETIKSDGTKVIDTTISDKDQTSTTEKSQQDKKDDANSITEKEKTVTYSTQSTIISLGAKMNLNNFINGPSYGLIIQKRLLGPIYVGGEGYTDMSFGINAGIAF